MGLDPQRDAAVRCSMIKPHGLSLNSKGAHGLRLRERRRTAHSEMAATPTTSGAGKKTQSAGINWSGRESVMMPQVSIKPMSTEGAASNTADQ